MMDKPKIERLYITKYPTKEWSNKCPKCECISLNFIYFQPIDKWLCPCCDNYVNLYIDSGDE